MAEACGEQGCVLTGGETSIQPGVVAEGEYVLSASGIGVVEKIRIIDGSRINPGDVVLAVASNGLHTNGYTLIRKLLEIKPGLKDKKIGIETFFEIIMRPHKCYYNHVKKLFNRPGLKGLAHITGGGIQDNLNRILPKSMDAVIKLENLRISEIFKVVRDEGNVSDREMLRTFNMGVGLIIVCSPESQSEIESHLKSNDCECYYLGNIDEGSKNVRFEGSLEW
jgi:phosphoribosylformylglycinamidine cyclo-ligase